MLNKKIFAMSNKGLEPIIKEKGIAFTPNCYQEGQLLIVTGE